MLRRNIRLLPLGVEVGRRFAFYGDVLCKREGMWWLKGGGGRRGRRLAILGDSVDTMGSQYITSPNPTPSSPLSLFSVSFTSPAFLLSCPPLQLPSFLRSSTNEAPRCRNSLGAGVIAATVFLERVIVQQRRNGIARERGWAEGRQQGEWKRALAEDDGKENAERSRRRIADPMLKDPGQNDGERNNCGRGQTITRMRNVAYGAMHRGSHGAEIESAVSRHDWKLYRE